ncbi:TPA: EscC/YscC/HrcC family type III secretion system outer membrane ring protein [Escherichia coli]|uniref:type III secretion system outer membrane ring subunit SctC n=1 Tax=Escherichia coli TaxID=562 RepID=UPI001AE0D2D8|nr:type III secretion system outer membrane ring subunit SctC [Escherichia coli]EFU2612365.1 EscC/YscC/HrcC family type III secretion system outer membrane ring protein [Escherichia coli]MBP0551503.1 type III secretion system outer membrane ring subunit SctC [Escherichia coli]MED9713268.1 type III secretion system outer membrane ring subunit SctC [Escherichia coli]HAY0031679.1 EscC/YscC/HrcC family type III secretion system outer membrane ring protein [Escherichia coli]HEI2834264.1 EscC/YscC/H
MKPSNIIVIFIVLLFGISPFSIATGSETLFDNGYVARNDSLNSFFEAMSTKLNKTVVVSKSASRKKINGNFNFRDPEALLDRLASQLGVIWYSDGQTIYIYDAEEIRNSVISLQNISLSAFKSFLKEAGLYDSRYPLKGDEQNGIVYISGPPIFVSIVTKTAALIDKQNNDIEMGRLKIGVFRLHNTFVNDRTYQLRDQNIVIPGIATVIEKLLAGEQQNLTEVQGRMFRASGSNIASEVLSGNSSTDNEMYIDEARDSTTSSSTPISDIKVISYPDTNSLLVKGTAEQVDFIGALVRLLDVAKRHVELSLWIIDLNKNDLEQLGVAWGGSTSFSNKLDIALNQTLVSTLDGVHFLASVYALEKKNQARIVSKPVLMTQENVPAIFDNNRTFYTKLIGERNSSLAHVTYGTMISVLPRFSADGEIEMSLNIEDGNEEKQSVSGNEDSVLPEVGRTHISTVARVPQGKSLLIGGYTRDSRTKDVQKIPLLGDIPLIGSLFRYENQNQNNVVRVFLIQPKEILDPLMPDADVFAAELMQDSGIENNRDPLDKWVLSYLNRGQALNHGK